MNPNKLTKEEREENLEFFLNVRRLMKGGGEVTEELVREMRDRIASLLKSDAFTKGEGDELADMCLLLHRSLEEDES